MKILTCITIRVLLLLTILSCTGCEAIGAQFLSPAERYRLEGERLLEEDRTAEAILAFRAAVDQDPTNLAAVKRLSQLYADQGRLRLALRLLERVSPQFPQEGDLARLRKQFQSGLANFPLWSIDLGDSEPVGFSSFSGRIYISLHDGSVVAIDPVTGAVKWKVKLPVQATATPAASADQVWVGAQDGQLYALAASDGALLWSFASKAPIYAPPVSNETTLFLSGGDGTFYAIDRDSQALRWSFTTGAPLHAQPALADGVVYFGSNDGHLYALDAASGQPHWALGILTQGAVESQAVIADGRVYFGSGDSRVYALATAAGGEYWHFSSPDAVYAAPLVNADTVYVASSGGVLTALDKVTGKEIWNNRTGSALSYPPILVNNILYYVTSGNPNVFRVDAKTGATLGNLNTGDWFTSGPILLNNTLYVLSKAGYLLAYPLD